MLLLHDGIITLWHYYIMALLLYDIITYIGQQSKALHLNANGVTTDPGSIPGCITTGRD